MNRSSERSGSARLHVVILLLYGAVLTWPALSSGYVPSRDVLIHLLWSTGFADQIWAGEAYPRWLDGMNGGLGSPVFFFYAPLPYYLTALLEPLFPTDTEGWRQLGAAASMAVIFSGLSAYCWLRRVAGGSAALVAAVVYMSAPYHLAFDLYQRFAFAELWSFVWLPLVLWGVEAVAMGRRLAMSGLALAYAALVLTHLPTTLIFSPVVLAYALLCGEGALRARRLAGVVAGMALGTGLAAAYLVPALATQANVSLSEMREGAYSYLYHFLYYGPRPNADYANLVKQQNAYAGVMVAVCAVAFMFARGRVNRAWAWQAHAWAGVAALAFVMMLPVARPVWDVLTPLQAIQFPWRFNVLLTLAMTVLVALSVASLGAQASRFGGALLVIACAAVIGQSVPTLTAYLALAASPGPASLDKMAAQFGTVSAEAREKVAAARLAIDVAEYRPRWVPAGYHGGSQTFASALRELRADAAAADAGTSSFVSRAPRRLVAIVDAPLAGWVTLPHFYYPGWRASIGEPAKGVPLRPSDREGLIEVQLAAGRHVVTLELEPSRAERIGLTLSGVSVVLLAWLALSTFRRRP